MLKNQTLPILLCCTATVAALLSGCGKKDVPPQAVSSPMAQTESVQSQKPPAQGQGAADSFAPVSQTSAQEPEGESGFDYKPGTMGVYVMADSSIEADPSVLDSLTMTLPNDVTQIRVSDRQFDFIKNGMQVGGFLLVEFPDGMLEKAAETTEDFDAMSDYLATQTMSGVYPAESRIWGGGDHPTAGYYAMVFINKYKGENPGAQYMHRIYIGEHYCYDFWIDEGWWADSGFGIVESLSAEDIKPELNQVEFSWSPEDRPRRAP